MDSGRPATACREPVLMKSRCCCEAWRLVKMSECSSEFCSLENERQSITGENEAYGFCSVEKLVVQVESLLV